MKKFCDCYSCRSGAIHNDLQIFEFPTGNFVRVQKRCKSNDCGTVLVVMKDRNIQFFYQAFFDFKATWRANIFEINSAESRSDITNCFNYFIDIFCRKTNWKSIDFSKLFKQNRFTFHNGHSGFRTDIAETENCCSVGNNGDKVSFTCIFKNVIDIFMNAAAWFSDTRSISYAQVIFIFELNAAFNFYFSVPFCMTYNSFFVIVH